SHFLNYHLKSNPQVLQFLGVVLMYPSYLLVSNHKIPDNLLNTVEDNLYYTIISFLVVLVNFYHQYLSGNSSTIVFYSNPYDHILSSLHLLMYHHFPLYKKKPISGLQKMLDYSFSNFSIALVCSNKTKASITSSNSPFMMRSNLFNDKPIR